MKPTFNINDKLLRSLVQGDFVSFKKVFDNFSPSIHGAALECFRSETLAKQFVAEIFSQVWRERSTFKDASHFNSRLTSMLRELVHPYFIKALDEQIALSEKRESESRRMEAHNETVPGENGIQ